MSDIDQFRKWPIKDLNDEENRLFKEVFVDNNEGTKTQREARDKLVKIRIIRSKKTLSNDE